MTVAASKGFLSRAQLGMRVPRSVSRSFDPRDGGVTYHYAGGPQRVSPLLSGHTRCVNLWRGYQNYHMDSRNYVDIAYTGGVCQHGFTFAGRGAGIRTGANGTNSGNYRFYAVCWIGGEGETPTKEALQAMAWWVRELRRNGGAGMRVVPHSFHKATGCPGAPLKNESRDLDGQQISGDAPTSVKDYAQVVIGANEKDLFAGIVIAKSYNWALCLATGPAKIEGVWPHPGVNARAGWGLLVGSAQKLVKPTDMPNGGEVVAGTDWTDTGGKLAQLLKDHPPGTERRDGEPW